MVDRDQAIGRRITRLLQTNWKPFEGFEMEGIAGAAWFSCECFIEVEGRLLLKLGKDELREITGPRPELIEAQPVEGTLEGFVGERIHGVDISSPENHLIVVLDHGKYIENDHVTPGGNKLRLSNFTEWSEEDKKERFVDYWDRKAITPWDR